MLNYYIPLVLFATVVLIVGSFDHAAHGQIIRPDILEDKIDKANKDILILDLKIERQNERIQEKDKIIDEKKQALRDLKDEIEETGDESFKPVAWIKAAELKIENAIIEYQNSREQLKKYITERSDLFKLIKEIQKELDLDVFVPIINGTGKGKLVGIELSNTCIILNQFDNSKCPSYQDLNFLDSSNEEISGGFVNGTRLPSPVLESWRYYDVDKIDRVFVDPPQGMSDRIHMITIVPSLDNYTLNSDMGNGTDRFLFHDRYIDKCKKAIISASVWLELIPITLFDFRNNCIDSDFEEREVIPINQTEIDITTSPNWKYNQWLNESKNKCKGLCFEY